MCNLFNYLANVSTIQILHVHETLFGTRLTQNPKTKKTKTPPHVLFSGLASGDFFVIRYERQIGPILRNNRTAGFDTFRRNQSISTHVSQTQSVSEHVTPTIFMFYFCNSTWSCFKFLYRFLVVCLLIPST